eukprot:GHRR01014571.1.p1 GENE.GHRR01014571.1~~GHRR01014571.1.p1  ORF type:complete len:136 (+),score=47.07 GHRR01014571.1:479-886(+)
MQRLQHIQCTSMTAAQLLSGVLTTCMPMLCIRTSCTSSVLGVLCMVSAGGWIYDGREPFDKLPNSYRCPVCNAPKRRFRQTEASGKRSGSSSAARRSQDDGKFDEGDKNFFVIAAAGGAALLGALYFFLNSQTQL